MERALIETHLQKAREHVALGEQHLLAQRKIVEDFERQHWDATIARQLLQNFEDIQYLHLLDLERLQVELAQCR